MGGGKEVPEGMDICIPMAIHVDIWQKSTQYCKAIILQLKVNLKNKRKGFQGQKERFKVLKSSPAFQG